MGQIKRDFIGAVGSRQGREIHDDTVVDKPSTRELPKNHQRRRQGRTGEGGWGWSRHWHLALRIHVATRLQRPHRYKRDGVEQTWSYSSTSQLVHEKKKRLTNTETTRTSKIMIRR